MARIPAASRETVPQNQVDEFDQLVQDLGGVPRFGPGSVMIHVPKAHQLATALNNYLRRDSSLPEKALELAMLLAARENDCQHYLERPRRVRPRRRRVRWSGGRPARQPGIAGDGRRRARRYQLRPRVLRASQGGARRVPGRNGTVRQAGPDRVDTGHRQLQPPGLHHQCLRPRPAAPTAPSRCCRGKQSPFSFLAERIERQE